MSWLDLLLDATEESEAPERYFWWSGLAAISAVVRKNVWLDRFIYKLYPNIYVALISSKSGARKGIPISVCKRLLEETNLTRIISGCNSIQGMIYELGQQKTLENGTVIGDAHGILLSDEFDSFLTDDPKSLTYLTALYNTHEHEKGWEKTLKNSPKSVLKSPCLTMLVASNEMLFDSVVKRKDIEGGFIGRTILVKEGGVRRLNPLVRPPKHRLDIPGLAVRLVEIGKIKGEFKLTSQSIDMYESWYNETFGEDHDDRTGTYNRLGDQVLKVAMLISLSRKDDLDLEWSDIELAIEKCLGCVDAAVSITSGTEASNGNKPNSMKLVLESLVRLKFRTTKTAMLRWLHPYQIGTSEAEKCIKQLLDMGYLVQKMIPGREHINDRTFLIVTDEGMKGFKMQAENLRKSKRVN